MRPIDADALKFRDVKVTTNEIDIFGFGGYLTKECKGILQEEIWNTPTIDVMPKWIPCEEKLPEPAQEVLVTGINNCVYTSRIVHGEFEYGGNVIAWMPLPEPYIAEREK